MKVENLLLISVLVIIGIAIAIPNVYAGYSGTYNRGIFVYEDSEIRWSVNGKISDMIIDEEAKSLTLKLFSYKTNGWLDIWLPRDVIDAKSGSRDVDFTVLINGKLNPKRCDDILDQSCPHYEYFYGWKEIENPSLELRRLSIRDIDIDTTKVEIIGTHMFGSAGTESPVSSFREEIALGFIYSLLHGLIYNVVSDSMVPAISQGDTIIVEKTPFEQIKTGDVIIFKKPTDTDRVIIHRVVEILNENPKSIRAKGDANPAPIPGLDFPITENLYIGKAVSILFADIDSNVPTKQEIPIQTPLLENKEKGFSQEDKLVILYTPSGKLVIEFFPEVAPNHVDNFIKLVESGFYDRTIFHRVIKDFMIQGGDPKTKPNAYDDVKDWGTGNPGYTIDAEFNDIKHNRGIVSMARSQPINSAGSQFFIVHQDSNFLDGQYTVFGRIVTQESFETLDKIANLETPEGVNIPIKWGETEILSAEVVNRNDVLTTQPNEIINVEPFEDAKDSITSNFQKEVIEETQELIEKSETPITPSDTSTKNEETIKDLLERGNQLFDQEKFGDSLAYYEQVLEIDSDNLEAKTAKNLATEKIQSSSVVESSEGGGCLIATATFGSELSLQVQMLREIRDNSLLQTQSGQSFMQGFNEFYYSFSPTIADWERQNPVFKEAVKLTITPLLTSLSILNYVDMDSESEVLGYGISLILMNIGMYFVIPFFIITKLTKLLRS